MPDRIFSEEEVQEIVRRAAQRQAEDAERREAREHGLTLDDLEQLGAEVGIDPAYLRRAADEVRTGRRAVAQSETQTDTHVIVERRIDAPFTHEAWEDTVAMLRQRFGADMGMWYGGGSGGRVEQVGSAHEWAHTSQLGVETRVSASERNGQTRLLLSQRVGHAKPKVEGLGYGALLGLFAGLIGSVGLGDVLAGPGWFVLAFVAILLLTTLAAAPVITRLDQRWRDGRQARLQTLAVDVGQIFTDAAPSAAEAGEAERSSETAPVPRLDLDALPEEEAEAAGTTPNRTRA